MIRALAPSQTTTHDSQGILTSVILIPCCDHSKRAGFIDQDRTLGHGKSSGKSRRNRSGSDPAGLSCVESQVVVLAVLLALSAGSIATRISPRCRSGTAGLWHLRHHQSCQASELATRNEPGRHGLGTVLTALTAGGGYLAVRIFG
jgi:hypothetical protein